MIYTTERIQKAIKNNKNIREMVKNHPNDQQLGEEVRKMYKDEIYKKDDSKQTRLNLH